MSYEQIGNFSPYDMEIMQPFEIKEKVYDSMEAFERTLTLNDKTTHYSKTMAIEKLVSIVTDLLSIEDHI